MFENIAKFFKKFNKNESKTVSNSKEAAKERLHLVLMQDRANVSADFLELMKQEIIEVIKKYIDVDETAIDVRLTNKENGDGTNGAPALYANIPIINIKNEARKIDKNNEKKDKKSDEKEEGIDKKGKENEVKNQEKNKEVVKEQDEKIDIATEKVHKENNKEKKIEKVTEKDVQKEKIKEQHDKRETNSKENSKKEKTKETIKSKN